MTSSPPSDPSDRRALLRQLPLLVLAAAAGAWIWLAVAVHTMPVVGGELDNYVLHAERFLQGRMASDRLHPLGLPLVLAGIGLFGVDLFLAGRLFGIACGLLLVTCAYRIVRVWAPRPVALLAAIAVGAGSPVAVCAVQACTDVPSAAFLALALWCWVRCAGDEHAPRRRLLLGGFALGFAASLRMPAITMLPAFLPVLLAPGWSERARRIGWSTLGGAVGLAPHLVTLWLSSGSLFKNTSQIVWKYRYANDDAGFLAYLAAPTPVAWSELLEWTWLGCQAWLRYMSSGLGTPWALAGWTVVVLSLWFSCALLLPLLVRHRAAAVLGCGGLAYSVTLCIFTMPIDRLTIPMALPTIVLGSLCWLRLPGHLRAIPFAIVLLAATSALLQLPGCLARFERLHARAEMAAARELIDEHGEWITIALPAVGLDPKLPCIFACYSPNPGVPGAPKDHWGRLRNDPAARAAQFVVVGRDTWPDVHAELAVEPPPAGYERLQNGAVLVFAQTGAVPWCAGATATVIGDDVHLELRLTGDVDRNRLAGAGFLVRSDADPVWRPMVLPAVGPDTFATVLQGTVLPSTVLPSSGAAPPVRWTLVPAMMFWDGSKQTGRAIVVTVPGPATGGR